MNIYTGILKIQRDAEILILGRLRFFVYCLIFINFLSPLTFSKFLNCEGEKTLI